MSIYFILLPMLIVGIHIRSLSGIYLVYVWSYHVL